MSKYVTKKFTCKVLHVSVPIGDAVVKDHDEVPNLKRHRRKILTEAGLPWYRAYFTAKKISDATGEVFQLTTHTGIREIHIYQQVQKAQSFKKFRGISSNSISLPGEVHAPGVYNQFLNEQTGLGDAQDLLNVDHRRKRKVAYVAVRAHEETHLLEFLGGLGVLERLMHFGDGFNLSLDPDKAPYGRSSDGLEYRAHIGSLYALDRRGLLDEHRCVLRRAHDQRVYSEAREDYLAARKESESRANPKTSTIHNPDLQKMMYADFADVKLTRVPMKPL